MAEFHIATLRTRLRRSDRPPRTGPTPSHYDRAQHRLPDRPRPDRRNPQAHHARVSPNPLRPGLLPRRRRDHGGASPRRRRYPPATVRGQLDARAGAPRSRRASDAGHRRGGELPPPHRRRRSLDAGRPRGGLRRPGERPPGGLGAHVRPARVPRGVKEVRRRGGGVPESGMLRWLAEFHVRVPGGGRDLRGVPGLRVRAGRAGRDSDLAVG